ncbi:conserved hypothetical protein [Francisella tularensis subsp. novicida GA99-3548]|uniref:hypothetical protein n=1 Tax=Francisella tularensis TaxID=263 RepID=UPI000158B479|nr:hypothetical protein [Francisella tularensis]AEB27015.1 hypothetical protein FNFX1_0067 [Francisella cf. novicida Fx1]AJI72476.1 hypothetical protein AQ14_802 [Francisella tularensis subsp. novicida D9876]APA82096.1 hypothetical protein N894_0112 [Francisella tularensis subsp. novicida PA10-7858]EDN38578.1 conserved hypothetical protein [Francisella tularensis subsp. novicida GA99-3548]
MKKISMLLICGLCFATGFGDEITTNNLSTQSNSGSSLATSTATVKTKMPKPSDHATPMAMNATPTPLGKDIREGNIPTIDQPKQHQQLVGSDPSTWTPAYLKVKKFKKCLSTENYRGWQGYCFPAEQPKECPDESWDELSKMNLIPCTNPSK